MSDKLELEATVNGYSYDLTDLAEYVLESIDGIGLPGVTRDSDRAAGQDGDTDRGFMLEPRFVDIVFGRRSSSSSDFWTTRTELRAIFKPGTDPIYFKFTLPNGDVRQIDFQFFDGLRMPFNSRGKIGLMIRDGITLKASDPAFYDPISIGWVYNVSGGGTGFPVPLLVPVTVGVSTIDEAHPLTYSGDWDSYPVIELEGPANNAIITNNNTGDVLDFTGLNLAAANKRIIDLTTGVKTVVDQNDVNRIDDLTEDSNLGTWRLVADEGKIPPTINNIRFQASSITSATELKINYYPRFIGI